MRMWDIKINVSDSFLHIWCTNGYQMGQDWITNILGMLPLLLSVRKKRTKRLKISQFAMRKPLDPICWCRETLSNQSIRQCASLGLGFIFRPQRIILAICERKNSFFFLHLNKLQFSMSDEWCCCKYFANSIHIFLAISNFLVSFIHWSIVAKRERDENCSVTARENANENFQFRAKLIVVLWEFDAHRPEMNFFLFH